MRWRPEATGYACSGRAPQDRASDGQRVGTNCEDEGCGFRRATRCAPTGGGLTKARRGEASGVWASPFADLALHNETGADGAYRDARRPTDSAAAGASRPHAEPPYETATQLDLSRQDLSDLSPVAGLAGPRELNLEGNAITGLLAAGLAVLAGAPAQAANDEGGFRIGARVTALW